MVHCLRDHQDPTGPSLGFQARLKPRLESSRFAGGISWSRRQSTMESLNIIPSLIHVPYLTISTTISLSGNKGSEFVLHYNRRQPGLIPISSKYYILIHWNRFLFRRSDVWSVCVSIGVTSYQQSEISFSWEVQILLKFKVYICV